MTRKISNQNLTELGRQIYYRLKPGLEKKHDPQDYVSIEVQSGDYFIGKSGIEAIKKAQKKYPRKKFFLAQVGRMSGILKWFIMKDAQGPSLHNLARAFHGLVF